MKRSAAPFLGSDIFDRFSKVPAVAIKVLCVVLALTVGLILGFSQDEGTVLSCPLAMRPGIFNANNVRIVGHHVAFRNREAAIPGFHLDPVIGDAEADGEAKSLREPVSSGSRVGVYQHRDHGTGRHRSVQSHPETLSLTPTRNLWRPGEKPVLAKDTYNGVPLV